MGEERPGRKEKRETGGEKGRGGERDRGEGAAPAPELKLFGVQGNVRLLKSPGPGPGPPHALRKRERGGGRLRERGKELEGGPAPPPSSMGA